MKRIQHLVIAILLLLPVRLRAQEPVAHPRLLMRSGAEPALVHAGSRRADSLIVAFCDQVLDEPPVERVMVGRRLLHTSREALKRIFWLSYTFRMHGGQAYARRAVEEMLAVSRFPDWNPQHFLDVGEMALGVAIGYDWLQDQMSAEEKDEIAEALLEKGLKPAQSPVDAWFYTSETNWNAVCNAGMAFAALALWERDPDFCRQMLQETLDSNPRALAAYSPEGGYPEGYSYWSYAASFQIMLDAALESAFDAPVYAPDREAFLRSADFIAALSTPAGHTYSFSDSNVRAEFQHMLAWMAWWRGEPSLLYPELRLWEAGSTPAEERLLPMFVLGLERLPEGQIPPPRRHFYRCTGTTPLFVYRAGWRERTDDYLAVKGGLSQSSHAHCDQGSFFFESDGVSWATDLGAQDYDLLERIGLDIWDMTQDSERWEVFRIGPFSHNILTVNGHVPKVNHPVTIDRSWTGVRKGAALDLSAVYSEDLSACRREVWLRGKTLHIKDIVEAADSVCVIRWAMCTEATPRIDGSRLILEADGHRRVLECRISGNAGTGAATPVPGIWPAGRYEFDEPNPGHAMVGFTLTLPAHARATLHVTLTQAG